MQFFKRSRSPASIGGHESNPPLAHPYRYNHHNFTNNHHHDDSNPDIAHAPTFSSDPFNSNSSDHSRHLDSRPSVRSSLLIDDDQPPEGHDHRHPAHRAAASPQHVAPTGLNRDHNEAPSLDTADLDQSSAEHSWSSPSPRSSRLDPEQQSHHHKQPAKLKKKNLFALHPHSSSPSSSAKDKDKDKDKDKSKVLGRSFSVRHKTSPIVQHQQQQPIVDRRRPSEPYLAFGQENGVGELLMQQDTDLDRNSNSNPPYGERQYSHPPRSPLEPSSTTQRVNTDPLDTNHFPHDQRDSSDPSPSQVSSQQHRMLPYLEELQPPSPLHPHHPAHQPDAALWRRRSPLPESSSFSARPSSQQSLGPSSPLPPQQTHHSDLTVKQQTSSRRPSQQPSILNPQSGDMTRQPPADSSTQAPLLRRDSQAVSGHSPYGLGTPQGSSSKGNVSQQNLQEHEQGQETPPSALQSKSRDDLDEVDVAALIQKHEELQAKYNKVKRYYFEKEAQVQQLQNTVAHQRMAMSRTVLDDNEYTARFTRLDGAIKDLAFSIRKDWANIPNWLQGYVTEDAVTVGTKEMTAVGRAVISRWLVDEIFDRHFHPDLEANLSLQLKNIESNLRRQQVQVFTEEDKENQIARISNWRRTTLDGLTDVLQAKSAQDHRSQLTENLIEKLTASLGMSLKDPPPPEVEQGARMIVENALGIAEKIPMESRDICVEYFMPGTTVSETVMKIETGLPALSRPGAAGTAPSQEQHYSSSADRERARRDSLSDEMDIDRDVVKESSTTGSPSSETSGTQPPPNLPSNRDQRKKYVFGNFMSKKSSSSSNSPVSQQQDAARPGSAAAKDRDESDKPESRSSSPSRIRFAAFMAVEVRGKGPNNVLIKAPVYVVDP
ncbi:hypothetical protein VTN77DRAFT_1305 [Rasamsonia byssochlamydoides]|uniref:uncharacterized protein n=1 Tax=Rasamsonia byssochlamydoides TaxID=89139 RepID=UPI0037443377